MKHGKLTKDQAIAAVGIDTVNKLDAINCEPTSRAYDCEDGEIEWAGQTEVDYNDLTAEQVLNLPVGGCWLWAIYYTDADDSQYVEDVGGDWSVLSWTVHHYEIR